MTEIEARETPGLRVVESAPAHSEPTPVVSPPPSQTLIDAVTQLEANKKDVSPKGFQKRLQLAYAIYDQASLMVQEIEAQHARLVTDLMAVERRSPLAGEQNTH
jgi:hypothetical protein